MSDKRIAVVTGSNKGIGFEIVKKLAAGGLKTIVAARNEELGRAAAAAAAEFGDVEYRNLDISDPESIQSFVEGFEREFGRCDVLVNNAGIAFKGADPTPHAQQARPTFATNYFGTTGVTLKMLPLLRKGQNSKVITLASKSGQLKILSEDKVARITSVSLTPEDVNAFANEFITDVEAGVHQERGWPNVNLGMSQLCKIAFHKALANKLRDENVVFAMACPGHCRTDMSSQNGSKSAEEGSRTPAWLALMDATESATINGKFFSEEVEIEW